MPYLVESEPLGTATQELTSGRRDSPNSGTPTSSPSPAIATSTGDSPLTGQSMGTPMNHTYPPTPSLSVPSSSVRTLRDSRIPLGHASSQRSLRTSRPVVRDGMVVANVPVDEQRIAEAESEFEEMVGPQLETPEARARDESAGDDVVVLRVQESALLRMMRDRVHPM